MANVTDPLARPVHGTNPQNLIEYIVRQKIYDSQYWKEECFGLSARDVTEKAALQLHAMGGTYGPNNKPTRFLCLILKLLQIQPDDGIVDELLSNEDFKYVRALGAFYLRLTGRPCDIYSKLEPLYNDYRTLRRRESASWTLLHMDEFIDELLLKERVCGIAMPRLPKRQTLEEGGYLDGPRQSAVMSIIQEVGNGDAEKVLEYMANDGGSLAAQQALKERRERMEKKRKDKEDLERKLDEARRRWKSEQDGKRRRYHRDELERQNEDRNEQRGRGDRSNSIDESENGPHGSSSSRRRSRSRSRSWGRTTRPDRNNHEHNDENDQRRPNGDEESERYRSREDGDHRRRVHDRNYRRRMDEERRGYADAGRGSRYDDRPRSDDQGRFDEGHGGGAGHRRYYEERGYSDRDRYEYDRDYDRYERHHYERERRRRRDDHDRRGRGHERKKDKKHKKDDSKKKKKKYGTLFKKDIDKSESPAFKSDRQNETKDANTLINPLPEEGSEEYWNEQRAKLGLKPLRK